MNVIGIDFGNDSCVVSSLQNNRVEIIVNDYYERKTPSYVAFSENKRLMGVSAKNQINSNLENTIYGFKDLLGKAARKERLFDLIQVFKDPFDESMFYDVEYMNKKEPFTPLQIASMMLGKLKADANVALEGKTIVSGCVLAVPSYFTPEEKNSLLVAAKIAELNCQFMIKETTATAINYGFYNKFPTSKNVAFVDFGHSAIQVFICMFSEKKLEIVSEASKLIGGRDIDDLLAAYFIEKLNDQNLGKENKIFCIKLLDEVEKMKKKMSADTDDFTLNIKHLVADETELKMRRSEMEEICAKLFKAIEKVMRKCLKQSGLEQDEIHSIEIVGGSTRIPKVKQIICEVFGKPPVATMNQDEAVSRGCAVRMFLSLRRKDFEIIEKAVAESGELNQKRDQTEESQSSQLENVQPEKAYNLRSHQSSVDDVAKKEPKKLKPVKMSLFSFLYREKNESHHRSHTAEDNTNGFKELGPSPLSKPLKTKLSELHANFKGNMDSLLDITHDELKILLNKETSMMKNDQLEDERRNARNKFDGRLTEIINSSSLETVIDILTPFKNWHDGSTKKYKKMLEQLNEFEKEVQKAEEAATVVTEQNSRVQIDQDSSETKQSTAPELQVENEKRECQKIQNEKTELKKETTAFYSEKVQDKEPQFSFIYQKHDSTSTEASSKADTKKLGYESTMEVDEANPLQNYERTYSPEREIPSTSIEQHNQSDTVLAYQQPQSFVSFQEESFKRFWWEKCEIMIAKTRFDDEIMKLADKVDRFFMSAKYMQLSAREMKEVEQLANDAVGHRFCSEFNSYRLNMIRKDFNTLLGYIENVDRQPSTLKKKSHKE